MAGVTLTATNSGVTMLTGSFELNTLYAHAGQAYSEMSDYFRVEDATWADTGYVMPGFPILSKAGGSTGGEFATGGAVAPTAASGYATPATVSGFVLGDNPSGFIVQGSNVPAWSAANPHLKFFRFGSGARIMLPWGGSQTATSITDKTVVGWDTTNNNLTDAAGVTTNSAQLPIKVIEITKGYVPVVSGGIATWTLGLVAVVQL